ncbi:MAG: UDP-N-acetylmuramate dehydrogenase [Treponema sp.]
MPLFFQNCHLSICVSTGKALSPLEKRAELRYSFAMHGMEDLRAQAERFTAAGAFAGRILFDEPMKNHTSFKIGGKAPLFIEPADERSFFAALAFLSAADIPYFTLGGGTNIVVSDEGFDGAVVSTAGLKCIERLAPDAIRPDKSSVARAGSADSVFVRCGAGVPVSSFVRFCRENLLGGAEEFAGLPGTIGGVLYMNAHCFNRSVSDLFVQAGYIQMPENRLCSQPFDENDWAYKVSPFQNTERIITSAVFCLTQRAPQDAGKLSERCAHFVNERRKKGHFQFPSAGSVFKNSRELGMPTGQVVDELGLKGMRIGGAQIAPWHGNIIINTGGATQKDVKELVDFIVNRVKEKKNFILQPEIIFCGK